VILRAYVTIKKSGYYNMAFIANNIASVQELGMQDSFMVAPLQMNS